MADFSEVFILKYLSEHQLCHYEKYKHQNSKRMTVN